MRKFLIPIVLILAAVNLTSCWNTSTSSNKHRTVLVYMVADNNLYGNALDDINEMERAWEDGFDGTLLVFLNPKSTNTKSKLYKIQKGSTNYIESEVLKEYGFGIDPCDNSFLAGVIQDARDLAPAENYGLVLWSHGTGWLPRGMPPMKSPNMTQDEQAVTYSFGYSDTHRTEMDIPALGLAMPKDIVFDFIAFDACYMGSIEVAYELRNKAKYVIASVSESWGSGYPYDRILPDMFAPTADVVSIATQTFRYYNVLVGVQKSSTMSVADCSKLPALASSMKELIQKDGPSILPSDIKSIQTFAVNDFVDRYLFYDLGDYVNKTWKNSTGLAEFNAALDEVFIYKASTPSLFGSVNVLKNCGATAFIPLSRRFPNAYDIFSKRFDWAKDSGLGSISYDF